MKKFPFLSVSILVVGFCACISCAYFVSNVLVVAGLFSNTNSVFVEKQSFFAISVAESETQQNLQEKQTQLQSQNGAGFVYEKDGKFFLLASVYENKADAELVKNNLKNQELQAEILTLDFSSQQLDGNFSADEKLVLLQCLKAKTETFKKLYDVAISLDTSVLDNTKAKLACNNIFSQHVSTKTNFETIFKNKNLQNLEEELKNIETQLSSLIAENYENENQTFSSLIKLTYCKILLG